MQRSVYSALLLLLCVLAFEASSTLGQLQPSSVPLAKWAQPLVKPPVYQPVSRKCGIDKYVVTLNSFEQQLHPSLPPSKVLVIAGCPTPHLQRAHHHS
jgi:hypothetical protein